MSGNSKSGFTLFPLLISRGTIVGVEREGKVIIIGYFLIDSLTIEALDSSRLWQLCIAANTPFSSIILATHFRDAYNYNPITVLCAIE